MSDYIPEELVNGILLRLPAKTLVKFTAVCKSWRSLIKSSSFIAAHLQFNTENEDARLLFIAGSRLYDTSRFLGAEVSRFYCLHPDTLEFGDHSNTNLIAPPPPVADETKTHQIIGTCNGLVCMVMRPTRGLGIVLWNPSTRRYVCSPSPITTEMDGESFSFGYDSVNNDYKVLRVAYKWRQHFTDKTHLAHEVWSLAKGVWKSLISTTSEEPKRLFGWNFCSNVNSTLHRLQVDVDLLWFIETFNLANESFGQIELPKRRGGSKSRHIRRYGDSLAYIQTCPDIDTQRDWFYLWVMKEYAVAESWTIICTVDLGMVYIDHPFSFRRSGSELMLGVVHKREHSDESQLSLISVNLKSKQAENFGIDGYEYDFVDSITDSLVLVEQANAISY